MSATEKAEKKREASRRCIIKKRAEEAKMSVDAYVKKEFGVTLNVYVSDAFHNKGHTHNESSDKADAPKAPRATVAPSRAGGDMAPYTGPDMTVEEFFNAWYDTDAAGMRRAVKNISSDNKIRKEVLSSTMLADNYDTFYATELNVNRQEIEEFILKRSKKKHVED